MTSTRPIDATPKTDWHGNGARLEPERVQHDRPRHRGRHRPPLRDVGVPGRLVLHRAADPGDHSRQLREGHRRHHHAPPTGLGCRAAAPASSTPRSAGQAANDKDANSASYQHNALTPPDSARGAVRP